MPDVHLDRIDIIARDLRARHYDRKGYEMSTLYVNLPTPRRNNWRSIAKDAIELVEATEAMDEPHI